MYDRVGFFSKGMTIFGHVATFGAPNESQSDEVIFRVPISVCCVTSSRQLSQH